MSIAWGTLVIVILLLPGIFCLFGLFSSERYSREVALNGPIYALVLPVGISLLIHGVYYIFIDPFVYKFGFPAIDVEILLSALLLGKEGLELEDVAKNISDFRLCILLYFFLTTVCGFVLGFSYSFLVLKGIAPALTQHGWIKELIIERQYEYVWVYILTRIQENRKIIMYKGMLKEFYAKPDGSLSYIVLSNSIRYYMELQDESPGTSEQRNRQEVSRSCDQESTKLSHLLIEGGEISNIYFEKTVVDINEKVTVKMVQDIVERVKQETANEHLG